MQNLLRVRNICVIIALLMVCMSAHLFAQNTRIFGKVSDKKSGIALQGASVRLKVGTKVMGSFVDKEGKFQVMNVPPGTYDVTATILGYKPTTKKITVSGGDFTQNFELSEDLLLLEEAVVIGYGTKQKRDLTGAVASVKAEEIQGQSVQNVGQVLQGRTSGVQVTQSNGMAGSGMTFRVRGVGSIGASSEPLIVIDGIPVQRNQIGSNTGAVSGSNTDPLADINPNDIESIDVLKDAAAAAIYGSRASNGVVLITTKRGKEGTTKLSVNYFRGYVTPSRKFNLLSTDEWLGLYREAYRNDSLVRARQGRAMWEFNLPEGITEQAARGQNTNWIDEVTQLGTIQEVNVSASGGNDKTQFFLGGTYRNENGYTIINAFERMSIRMSIDHKASDRLKFGTTMSINNNIDNRVPTSFNGGLGAAQSTSLPFFPVYNPDGTFWRARQPWLNPVAQLNNVSFVANSLRILAGGFLDYKIMDGLVFRSQANVDLTSLRENSYTTDIIQPEPRAEDRRVSLVNWNTSNFLMYDASLAEDHVVNATVGMEVQKTYQRDAGLFATQFPNNVVTNPGAGLGPRGYAGETGNSFLSYFGRIGYKFMNRYIFSASARTDGSSRFGPENRYGFFPSASFAWVMSDEDFIKGSEVITYLKLRTSYGLTGNASIGDFTWRGNYAFNAQYAGQQGSFPVSIQNSQLTWEKSAMLDIAADFGLFNDRISGSVGYFRRRSYDLLLDVSIPASSGFRSVKQNVGEVVNQGLEFNIRSYNISSDEFTWSSDFNITFLKNTVTDVAGISPDAFDPGPGENRIIVGQPIGVIFINKSAGVDPQTGNPMWYTLRRSTGAIDSAVTMDHYANTTRRIFDDRQVIGSPYPSFYGGLTNTFSYNNFDLTVLINFQYGNYLYDDAAKQAIGNMATRWNQRRETLDRWQRPGDVTNVPRLTLNSDSRAVDQRGVNSDLYAYDASFIRVRNVVLGYSLPKSVIEPLGLSRLRIYMSGTNLFLFTSFPGWDPEIIRDNSNPLEQNLRPGSTYLHPPQARTIMFGINIDF